MSHAEPSHTSLSLGCHRTPTDRRKLRRVNWIGLFWMAGFVATTFVGLRDEPSQLLGWGLIALTTVLGIATIAAYVDFLKTADELLRKIQLEALSLAFGVGMVFSFSYRLCEQFGAPQLDVNDPMLLMIVVWAVGQALATRRYR